MQLRRGARRRDRVAAMAAGARPVAGGTDLVVGARQGKAPLPAQLVGIHRIAGLPRSRTASDGATRGGPGRRTRRSSADPRPFWRGFPGLADARAIVGSHATRANGTLGGNVMNASPAMDTGAPLLCHGAVAVLPGPAGDPAGRAGRAVDRPGRDLAAADELLVAIELPAAGRRPGSAYVRLQYRRQMEIAVVGAAAVVTDQPDGAHRRRPGRHHALAPVIHRVPGPRRRWSARDGGADAAPSRRGRPPQRQPRPISDVRGSAAYRRAMAAVITRRAVQAAAGPGRGRAVSVPASDSQLDGERESR